jgi:hypothetical protein
VRRRGALPYQTYRIVAARDERAAHRRVHSIVIIAALAPACGELGGPDDADEIGSIQSAATVSDYVSGTCSTEVVLGLSRQISDEVQCLEPDALAPFDEGGGIVFSGSAVLPYLDPKAARDLAAAVAARGGELRINSAFRTVAQQYLLYQWFSRGLCGIAAAATPGRSNHESGRALDVGNYGDWIGALGDHGWAHDVPGDDVHFDHLSSPDLRGYDVLAFQRLWNRNHPDDEIDEDGLYGPQTESRLARSPADGFGEGACGAPSAWDGQLVAADAPAVLAPGERADVLVTVRNTGSETWQPGSTFLGTSGPKDRDSALYDPASWSSSSRPATVEAATPKGEVGRFRFTILAPDLEDETLHESFRLVDEGNAWFGPTSIDLEIMVSSSPPDTDDGSGSLGGGCAAAPAGSAAGACALIPFLVPLLVSLATRRRRASRPPRRAP